MEPVLIGLIGCGAISAQYLRTAALFPGLAIAACADLDPERARTRAEEFGVSRVLSVDALLGDPEIEVVLNLTVPRAHAALAVAALEAGKHTFLEKPLGVSRAEGEAIRAAAKRTGLRVGCAPDTFLGAGLQTARLAVDRGDMGRPTAFTALMLSRGHESWHPSPEFYYEPGGGPMFDMGPYYLTALLNLLGPVRRLAGFATTAIPERVITSEPKRGKSITVETPDHVCGLLEFEGGAAGTLVTSFATAHGAYERSHPITLYGTEGALKVPDPNAFDGPVLLRRNADPEWVQVPSAFPAGYGRAAGLADLAAGLRAGRPHRCSLEQSFAVLDAMQGFLDSSEAGVALSPTVPYARPEPLPPGAAFGQFD